MGQEQRQRKRVIIYTDGACSGNPGRGGYAAILLYYGNNGKTVHRREIAGGYRYTTNNRMELMAVIRALEQLKYPVTVEVYTDSRYLANALQHGWLERWKRSGWRRPDGRPVRNRDLWQRLDQLLRRHRVTFHWIEGHSGIAENEMADQLAVAAMNNLPLAIDEEYERTVSGGAKGTNTTANRSN